MFVGLGVFSWFYKDNLSCVFDVLYQARMSRFCDVVYKHDKVYIPCLCGDLIYLT